MRYRERFEIIFIVRSRFMLLLLLIKEIFRGASAYRIRSIRVGWEGCY